MHPAKLGVPGSGATKTDPSGLSEALVGYATQNHGPRPVAASGTEPTLMSKWRICDYGLASTVCGDGLASPICRNFVMKNSSGISGLAREERLQIMLAPAELNAVDNFRFEHRMPSRAAAVRELLRHGIAAVGVVMENAGVKSGDYGVLKAPKGVGSARKAP
jgi:hypothetical protein